MNEKGRRKKLMSTNDHSSSLQRRYRGTTSTSTIHTYNLHNAESKLVHRYFMISHMIIPSNPLAPSFKFGRGLRPDTRRIIALGLYSYRSHRDLQEANASGHNAKQSFRYLVTIRKLPTPNSWAD